ncbi:MAG: zinc ribbon domain-containing protein [Planctomycetes bacterium]|nr:zinc ribbon domain-containing protein [Planctomycetota bacterium]
MSSPPGEGSPPPPAENHCPECGAELPPGAVLCVACGFDLKEGRQLETVREPEVTEPPAERPEYRIPDLSLAATERKKELEKTLNLETRIFWLEEQVRDLQRRVSGTRLTAPEFSTRMFAVLGLWLVGFLAIAFCFGALGALLWVTIVGV